MAQARTQHQAPQPEKDTSLMSVRAPWEKDETLPDITFTFRQKERGRWFADRTIVLNSLDPLTEEGTIQMLEILNRIDEIARVHIRDVLYPRDQEERDAYFREHEQRGYGSGNWNDRK